MNGGPLHENALLDVGDAAWDTAAHDPHRDDVDLACVFVEEVSYDDWGQHALEAELESRGLSKKGSTDELSERLQ